MQPTNRPRGRPKTSVKFRKAVEVAFQSLAKRLRKEGTTPATEIARTLGVSKQTAYQYLKGKAIPGPDRLAKVIQKWDLELEIDGHRFGKEAFPTASYDANANSGQIQLELKDIIDGTAEIPLPGTESKLRVSLNGSTLSVSIDLKRIA